MMSKLRVIFGGSFDPITKAHLEIAKYVRDELTAEVFFVPSAKSYKNQELTDFYIRYYIINATISGEKDLRVSESEFFLYSESGQAPKTIDILVKFKRKKGDLGLLMGADNFVNLHKWDRIEEILEIAKPIVYPRDGIDVKASPIYDKAVILDAPEISVSSSQVRESGNVEMLDEKTLAYINQWPKVKAIYL